MSLPQNFGERDLAGQRLMAGFDGTQFNRKIEDLIEKRRVGGLILFARNLGTPEEIGILTRTAQACAKGCGLPPLLIAIDQEGGQVARLKPPFTQFPSPAEMANEKAVTRFARITARELNSIGVNMNMAPVLDIAHPRVASVMTGRAFGEDPVAVARLGCLLIDELQEHGIAATAKHFPGIGRTVLDSHAALPDLETSLDRLLAFDLIPFKAAQEHRVAAVMLSHIRYTAIDATWPASLSVKIARGVLRDTMGFEGLVITDDLDMGAIAKHFGMTTVIDRIVAARIDMALICHQGPDIRKAFERLLANHGQSSQAIDQGIEAVDRILALKERFIQL